MGKMLAAIAVVLAGFCVAGTFSEGSLDIVDINAAEFTPAQHAQLLQATTPCGHESCGLSFLLV